MSSKNFLYEAKKEIIEDNLTSPCFQVNPDVELKDVPTNGEEYLLKTINERQNCAIVTKCDIDYTKFSRNQSRFVHELPFAQAPLNLKPTIEWQNIQVADFSSTRMYISRMLLKKSLWPPNIQQTEINPNNLVAWKNLFEKQDPTLTNLIGLPNASLDCGLEMLAEILDTVKPGNALSHKTGQWIYAFLACIRQPLVSDTISTLRDIARKCAKIRSHLDPDDENSKLAVAPLNIFICLIARYFRQYDLAD